MYFAIQERNFLKIGILSDIHGNLRALEAILRVFQFQNVDKIICLGDMIGYCHQSLDVLHLLIKSDIKSILGNHEAYLLGYLSCPSEKWQVYFLDQVKDTISLEQTQWLNALPKSLEIKVDGKKIAFFHGSPWNPLDEYIYNDYNFDNFSTLLWDYIFLGHTHYPMFKQVGKLNIVNPGSCGLPRDRDLRASAAVFDSENEKIFFIRESYDIQSTIKEARSAGVSFEVIKKLEGH